MTPREFVALLERHSERERVWGLRFGLVAAAVNNTMRQKKSDRMWQATDFVPSEKPRQVSAETIIRVIDSGLKSCEAVTVVRKARGIE